MISSTGLMLSMHYGIDLQRYTRSSLQRQKDSSVRKIRNIRSINELIRAEGLIPRRLRRGC